MPSGTITAKFERAQVSHVRPLKGARAPAQLLASAPHRTRAEVIPAGESSPRDGVLAGYLAERLPAP
jgi:hypothetical protein